MEFRKRIALHLLFWTVYIVTTLFTELYLSESFIHNPTAGLVANVFIGQLLLLMVKVPAVYYVIGSLLPRWLSSPGKGKLFLEAVAALLLFLACYRAVMHFIIWPY